MKKTLFLSAALLLCSLAHSQEAETTGSNAGLSIIPFLEMGPYHDFGERKTGFDFGNSSLFTLFEGSASEHFSWTLCNQWLINWRDGSPWDLYKNLGRSDDSNWIQVCLGNFSFSNWTFSLGKDVIATGGFEFDEWDWEQIFPALSPLWNELSCYQWGGRVGWTSNSEKTTLSLQATASPWGERPFASGLWNFSGQWKGEYGWFSNIWSVSAIQYEKKKYDWVVALGQRATLGDWTITLDYNNVVGAVEDDGPSHFQMGNTFIGTVGYAPSDKFDCSLKGIFTCPGVIAGAVAQFYPLKDSQDLKLHAAVFYDSNLKKAMLNIGARYNIRIHLW